MTTKKTPEAQAAPDEKFPTVEDDQTVPIAAGMESQPAPMIGELMAPRMEKTHPTDLGIFMSETFCKLVAAMAKARSSFKALKVSGKVDFTDRRGRQVKYDYPTLADLNDATADALAKQGLVPFHLPVVSRQGDLWVAMLLAHESGEFIASRMRIPANHEAKEQGAVITYCRRYLMSAILNLSAKEEDNEMSFGVDAGPQDFSPTPDAEPDAQLPDDNFGEAGEPYDPYS